MVQFVSYVRRVLHKTRLIFSRINGPNDAVHLKRKIMVAAHETILCWTTCRLVCTEFRFKIEACLAISNGATSQNVVSGIVGR